MNRKLPFFLILIYSLVLILIGLGAILLLNRTNSPLNWENAKLSKFLNDQGIAVSYTDETLLSIAKYIDLDGKDLPEMVIGIESGGTAGITKVVILRIDQSTAVLNLVQQIETYRANIIIENNELKIKQSWYGLNDANCCAQAVTSMNYRLVDGKLEPGKRKLEQVNVGDTYLDVTNEVVIDEQDYYYACAKYVFHSLESFGKQVSTGTGCVTQVSFGNLKFYHQKILEGPTDGGSSSDTVRKIVNGKNNKQFKCWVAATYKYIGCDLSAVKGYDTYLTYYFPNESDQAAFGRIQQLLENADPVVTK